MKKSKLSFLLVPLLLLTSCDNSKASIYKITNYDFVYENDRTEVTVDLTTQELIDMLESDCSFPLLFRSENCSSCALVDGYILDYVNKTNALIYSYEYSSKIYEYATLNSYNPELFPKKIITPRFLFIKEGILSIEINSSKFSSYDLFSKSLNAFLKSSNLYSLSSYSSHSNFVSDYNSYALFTYNKTNANSLKVLSEHIYSKANKTKTPIVIIDVSCVSNEDIELIKEYYSLSTLFNSFVTVENSNITNSVNYDSNLETFENLITTYFE